MPNEITTQNKLVRYWELGSKVEETIREHNDLSAKLFKSVSTFSSLMPDNLNKLSVLSDMITDALVVSGGSSLSKTPAEVKQENAGLLFNTDSGELTLSYKTQYTLPIKNKRSYIQTDTAYGIFNATKTALSSFEDLLKGSKILIESNAKTYRYTFCLEFSSKLSVNSLLIKLNENTDSYPLLSELYYITKENKKEYITILNSLSTSFDMDVNRVKDNAYTLLFDNIETNRIYFTLEDRDTSNLIIDSLSFEKLKYSASGSIVFGPIVSTHPILKASLEATGDVEGARFYLSYDKNTWSEVVLPSEISQDVTVNKIISFNTVSRDSIKVATDVKELYLKVELEQKEVTDESSKEVVRSEDFYASTLILPQNATNLSVYKMHNQTFFGDSTYTASVETSSLREPEHTFIINNGTYKVKGFAETSYSYGDKTTLNSTTVYSNYLKVGGDYVRADTFDPTTSRVYGYSISNYAKTCNTSVEDSVVIALSSDYARDTYTIRQNNRELSIDLSLGFITSCLDAVVGVVEELPVYLYDSTGAVVKELTIHSFEDFSYISLIEDGLFDLPKTNGASLNTLYPIKLNTAEEYGILTSSLVSVKPLITFEEISLIKKEDIMTTVKVSQENGNSLEIVDSILRDKYTESSTDSVKAYQKSRAVKLTNKHIQKGSLRITKK